MSLFIAVDGLDASGKQTQSEKLTKHFKSIGKNVKCISFPDYENKSSTFVKMYLNGELGGNPEDTNAYAASTFFAIDRYISFRQLWSRYYNDSSCILIANRYTSANAVHQLSKLDRSKWNDFLLWLDDYEFNKLAIPRPDIVIYLEMLPEISIRLAKERSEETGVTLDIHEKSKNHLFKSYEAAIFAAEKLGWQKIKCYEGNEPRTREAVFADILGAIGKCKI